MNKIYFSKNQYKDFKNLLKIKDNPSKIDKLYIKKATKYIKLIKWIPWLKMIWIWNSISMNYSNKDSDIDLFIITSKNRLWIVRFIITIIFSILQIRKTDKKHAWKLCLSFFCNDRWLNFEKISIKNDIYLYFWIIYLKPILDYNNTYNNFIKENSSWCDFKDYKSIIKENKKQIILKWDSYWNNCKILNLIEKTIKYFWLPKTINSYKRLWKPYWIVINNDILKFHNNDKRKEITNKIL